MNNIIEKDIVDVQKDNMLTYYMSLMYDRAIPDVRDGMKPVQRRILWSMFENTKALYNLPFKKVARCSAGALLYHPHGSASIDDALVRMSQDFVNNEPYIQAHGSNGSIDGSGAAASRYLEARLSKFGQSMMDDIKLNAVDFVPNFDNLEQEPTVLPSPTLNLLLNGGMGIAGGFLSSIPCYNLKDITDSIIKLIDNPDYPINKLAKELIPDFPTGGILCSHNDITKAQVTGRGNVRLRGKCDIVKNKNGTSEIVIREIPYMTTTGPKISSTATNTEGGVIHSIIKKVKDGTIEGIKDIQDHSKKELEIKIFIKKDYDPEIILNQLYKHTLLETTFKMIFICKNGNYFKQYNIKEIFTEWIGFRIDTIRRTIVFNINKAKQREHILDGLIIALNDIDNVVSIIKKSKNRQNAKDNLRKKYKLTELQLDSIVDTKLVALTNMEINRLINEKNEKVKLIKELMESLKDKNIKERIKQEQLDLQNKYKSNLKRKTQLIESEEITEEDIIPNEETNIIITNDNYIKRINLNLEKQNRNTIGRSANNIKQLFNTNTKDHLLCFTNTGRVYDIKVHQINLVSNISNKGKLIESYLQLRNDEKINNVLCLTDNQLNDRESFLIFISKNGFIKQTSLEHFSNIFANGIVAVMLRTGDSLVDVKYIDTSKPMQDVFIATKKGLAVRYESSEIPKSRRDTYGCYAMNLADDDHIVSLDIIDNEESDEIFFVTKLGLAKLVKVTDMVKKPDLKDKNKLNDINDGFPRLKRSSNIKGRIAISLNEGDELVKAICKKKDNTEALVITNQKINNVSIEDFEPIKRLTKGMILIKLSEDEFTKDTVKDVVLK